jgi:hypothetical protein
MKKLILLLPFLLFGDESFITQFEYGQMLYQNPRGIGCNNCHGEKGEGKIIANYTHKKKQIQLSAPKIIDIPYENFVRSFSRTNSIMPRYYLTTKEIQSIYLYLNYGDKIKKEVKK